MVDNDKDDDKSDRNVDVIEEYGDRHLMDDNDIRTMLLIEMRWIIVVLEM